MSAFDHSPYLHLEVAELHWVITSSFLMNARAFGQKHVSLPQNILPDEKYLSSWLKELDKEPSELKQFLHEGNNLLLGKRFESLLYFWLKNDPDINLLEKNVQIHQGTLTIGEIDFLVERKSTSEFIHIETACKYYLGSTSSSHWSNWIGPNATDTLEKKMSTFQRQLELFSLRPAKVILRQLGRKRPLTLPFLKGFFFIHFDQLGRHSLPHDHHPKCCTGWWMYKNEIQIFENTPSQWVVLPHDLWIAPYSIYSAPLPILSGFQLMDSIKNDEDDYSFMLIQMDERGFEMSRGIIVSNDWPLKNKTP